MAWAILEDITLDAHLDVEGRLVADTNVIRIAANLGVSKNTVATHLTRLRDAGFVLHEEGHHDPTSRYTTSRYVLDPSACVERFTHTPSPTHTDTPTAAAPSGHDRAGTATADAEHELHDTAEVPAPAASPDSATTRPGTEVARSETDPPVGHLE